MSDDSPMFQNVWLIHSQAGYLASEDTTYSIQPPTYGRYDVYNVGEVDTTYDTSVSVECATDPPTAFPTLPPTPSPTDLPTLPPSDSPTESPTPNPTNVPTNLPTFDPTATPTEYPTLHPTERPTSSPTVVPTPAPTFKEPCEYYKLSSDEIDEFDGNYAIMKNGDNYDRRNEAPQWQNTDSGYIIFYMAEGVFANRWTIQAIDEDSPLETSRDYYIVSPEVQSITANKDLNNPPTNQDWQVFSADTWHIVGDFFMTVDLECGGETAFPTTIPTGAPTFLPTIQYDCIYVNYTLVGDEGGSWFGVYTLIKDPEYKNGKVHYAGPRGNELYWMDEGIFGQRWILACSNGTVLAYEDEADSTNVPDKVLWQHIVFSSCEGHCVDFGNDINITITNLETCAPTAVPTLTPTRSPTTSPTNMPTLRPTALPTRSPTPYPSVVPTPSPTKLPTTPVPSQSPSLMPSPSPSAVPTGTTPEPTEHPTYSPTESPTTYPTAYCECIKLTLPNGDVYSMTLIADRNGRYQWEDGETGWTLYWVEDGLFGGTWILQGADHDNYYAVAGRNGDGMPPYEGSWQEFSTVGYNLASDKFTVISLVCVPCQETSTPTSSPTPVPTALPTPSPTCTENYIVFVGCCDDDFEGIYARQTEKKNEKYYYVNTNGYSLFYVHDGMFSNHWVVQSPDHDYFYVIEHTQSGDEPVLDEELQWYVYRGASFSYSRKHDITVECSYSEEPTRSPTSKPSPIPTKTPTRSPSPSPTIFPTLIPTSMPSTLPSPAPSITPSSLPTPSPSKLPTTSQPSSNPSLMPSPSPTKLPTTRNPTPLSREPTLVPTISPTKSPSDWCTCISVNSTGTTDFDGVFMHNGMTFNQHYVWSDAEGNRLYWGDELYEGSSWAIKVADAIAVYESVDPNHMNTPPLSTKTWTAYNIGLTTDGESTSLTLVCTTCEPTMLPTPVPTGRPSALPSPSPTLLPTTREPSQSPSLMPSPSPTKLPTTPIPSSSPSSMPSPSPSHIPSSLPTPAPTQFPTTPSPSLSPSLMPSPSPTGMPSLLPTQSPTNSPSTPVPSASPSLMPSPSPSAIPSTIPSSAPSQMPSPSPTQLPTTPIPSSSPSLMPSPSPSHMPTTLPTLSPTQSPVVPTLMPSPSPTDFPTIWCPCITVNTTFSGFSGSYAASGYIINQHHHWETHDENEIEWSYTSEKWVIISANGNVAIYNGDDEPWQNTPPIATAYWSVYEFNAITEIITEFELFCDSCSPTPMPTISPTLFPTTPLPTTSPSMMPSPSPTAMPSAMPSPAPTALPTTPVPSSSPSL